MIKDYDDYLTRRGQFLSTIDAAGREDARLRSEAPVDRDADAITVSSNTAGLARARLAELDAEWQAIVEQQRATTARKTLPDREVRMQRIEEGMEARRKALRQLEAAFAKPIKSAVAEYEKASAAVRNEVRALGQSVDQRLLNEIVSERGQEAKIVRALAFNAGLWGCGTQLDAFEYRDRDLNAVADGHALNVVEPVRAALFDRD